MGIKELLSPELIEGRKVPASGARNLIHSPVGKVMKKSIDSIQISIINLYEKYFVKLGIKKNGRFIQKSRWSFLRFPTYPLIGSQYAENKDYRVLFVGLEIGRDENPRGGIIGFDEKRKLVENNERHNPHVYGMGVATIFLLKKLFKNNQWREIRKGKTYKNTFKLANKFKPDVKPLSHIAMTNCYKFVTIKRKNRLGGKDRKNISTDLEWNLLEKEVKIFKPKFLVFESKDFKKDRWLQQLVSEIRKQNKNTKVFISNHPSYRSLHSNTMEYLKTFEPSIVKG